jgi:caffeoyl-CoA O-methyltransferase
VFTGYSSLAVGLAMQEIHGEDACLIACDLSEDYVARARKYWDQAASATSSTPASAPPPTASATCSRRAGGLLRPGLHRRRQDRLRRLLRALPEAAPLGGLLLIDNMLWGGSVADESNREADTAALRALAAKIHDDKRVDMALATIGDGLSMVVKR